MTWPQFSLREYVSRRDRSPFDVTVVSSGLRVTLDSLLRRDEGGALEYLEELLLLDEYEAVREAGPDEPTDCLLLEVNLASKGAFDDVSEAILMQTDGRKSYHGMWYVRKNIEHARQEALKVGLNGAEAARVELLACASAAVHSDIFVTDQPHLVTNVTKQRSNTVSITEALAVIGLHMRSTGWTTLRGHPQYRPRISLRRTELVQSWSLLPAVANLVQRSSGSPDWIHLLRETVYRMGRMLRARDKILLGGLVLDSDHRIDIQDELETLTLSAMGAFDIAARAVNISYSFGLPRRACSWAKGSRFYRKLYDQLPATIQAADDPTVSATINLVGGLRNTIHAEPLRVAGVHGPAMVRKEDRVLVPSDAADHVRRAARALGGADHWLTERNHNNEILVHAQRLADDLIPLVASAINNLVESAWEDDNGSPRWRDERLDSPGNPENSRRISWLYGY